ncbi:hypothetical protein BH23ACT6_BH23ACT6_09660 [soil metagenome]
MARFRNVDADQSDPLHRWPYEALVAALERGSIRDWAHISAAIKTDPWGDVARQVEDCLSYAQPQGLAGLMERAVARAGVNREDSERAQVARRVREMVLASGCRWRTSRPGSARRGAA